MPLRLRPESFPHRSASSTWAKAEILHTLEPFLSPLGLRVAQLGLGFGPPVHREVRDSKNRPRATEKFKKERAKQRSWTKNSRLNILSNCRTI